MADRNDDHRPVDPAGRSRERANVPTDAGRTSGGGSLGHDQPNDVADENDVRNQAPRRDERGREKPGRRNPVMPSNDATLNTNI